jgi:hypothetical protein
LDTSLMPVDKPLRQVLNLLIARVRATAAAVRRAQNITAQNDVAR